MTKLVFLDTETNGLRPDRKVWEVALIVRDDMPRNGVLADQEYTWFVERIDCDLGNADLIGLKIGRFFERHPQVNGSDNGTLGVADIDEVLGEVEYLTRGATLVGAVPSFDAEVLGNQMHECGFCPSWHYHLVDVETLAAGALRQPPPWGFDDLLAAYGLKYDEADRHTALGDARMARDLYDAVLTGAVSE